MIVHEGEFHRLVAALVPFTKFMLRNHGGFLPLGASVTAGEVALSAADIDRPPSTAQDWLELIKAMLRQRTSDMECAAVAYCVDVKLTDTRNGEVIDAVQIVFEHRSGEALEAFFPYREREGDYEFAQPMIRIGAGGLFETTSPSCVN